MNERGSDGRFGAKVTDADLIEAIERTGEPVVTAGELADELPIGRRAVRERLADLQDRGLVDRKDVGARAVVWWLVDTEEDDPAPAAPLEGLVGLLDDEEAARVRERSREIRESIDREVDETRRELSEDHD
jgi:DNA-binding Lrp family transcriptional regulator